MTRRVVAVGVGVGVEIDPAEIGHNLHAAVRRVVDERRFTDTAAAMVRSIDGHGGIEEALDIIERCARDRGARCTIENAAG